MSKLIGQLFSGPIDIIGDIHGEIDSLHNLLKELGYNQNGDHQEGRRIVFLGDLVDRGPNSPAVVELVKKLVSNGQAQCILGNHELNILRDERKDGNDWFMAPEATSKFPFTPATEQQKQDFKSFFLELPIALQREDLRVVHACWHDESAQKLLRLKKSFDAPSAYYHYEAELEKTLTPFAKTPAIRTLLKDQRTKPKMMRELAEYEASYQMGNPVRVLSSGEEAPATEPFWAGGQWRMVKREKWWDNYHDPVPVIIGHYWRYVSKDAREISDKHGPDLFKGISSHHWMGVKKNVYCVDFSVGLRHMARADNKSPEIYNLAALRWPEQCVVDEKGNSFNLA